MEKSNMYVILSAAISIDGKISTRSNDSKLSSQEDSIRLHKLRSKVDAILIGKNTLLQDDPLLTVRHTKGKNPSTIQEGTNHSAIQKGKNLSTVLKEKILVQYQRKKLSTIQNKKS